MKFETNRLRRTIWTENVNPVIFSMLEKLNAVPIRLSSFLLRPTSEAMPPTADPIFRM